MQTSRALLALVYVGCLANALAAEPPAPAAPPPPQATAVAPAPAAQATATAEPAPAVQPVPAALPTAMTPANATSSTVVLDDANRAADQDKRLRAMGWKPQVQNGATVY